MLKIIFEILTEPLGLPIDAVWEYLILLVIESIAFYIAWDASPGGKWGSEIHWGVKLIAFVMIWAVTYAIIAAVKWIFSNWVLVLCIIGGAALLSAAAYFIIRFFKKKRVKQQVKTNENNER